MDLHLKAAKESKRIHEHIWERQKRVQTFVDLSKGIIEQYRLYKRQQKILNACKRNLLRKMVAVKGLYDFEQAASPVVSSFTVILQESEALDFESEKDLENLEFSVFQKLENEVESANVQMKNMVEREDAQFAEYYRSFKKTYQDESKKVGKNTTDVGPAESEIDTILFNLNLNVETQIKNYLMEEHQLFGRFLGCALRFMEFQNRSASKVCKMIDSNIPSWYEAEKLTQFLPESYTKIILAQKTTQRRTLGAITSMMSKKLTNMRPLNLKSFDPSVRSSNSLMIAKAFYEKVGNKEMSFQKDDIITVFGQEHNGWRYGRNSRTNEYGWISSSFFEAAS